MSGTLIAPTREEPDADARSSTRHNSRWRTVARRGRRCDSEIAICDALGGDPGVTSVIEAKDGGEAVELARKHRVEVAVLDLNMPHLDGVAAALRLYELLPSVRIALHSSDPELLRQRAAGLDLPLFDKADFDRLVTWVERQALNGSAAEDRHGLVAPLARKVDLCCGGCGYGIVSRTPPARCPMCGGEATWTAPLSWTSRRAALREQRAS